MARITTSIVTLAALSCLAIHAGLRAQDPGAQPLNSKVETVATLDAPGNSENIGQGPDGSFYVTGLPDRILWKIDPNGRAEKFFTAPSLAGFFGVVANEDEIVLAIYQRPYRQPAPPGGGRGALDLSHVGSQILILDTSGNVKATVDGQDGEAFNGMAQAGKNWYLIADHNGTDILRFDAAKRKIGIWLTDDLLTQPNGIKVFENWVYVSCADKLYRVRIGPHGMPKGRPQLFATVPGADDFAFAPDGTMYIPSGTKMLKISRAGEVSEFLDPVPNGPSAWVTKDGKWLYWPTRAGPSKLMRVALR